MRTPLAVATLCSDCDSIVDSAQQCDCGSKALLSVANVMNREQWISVKDRMPKSGEDVILFSRYWSSRPFIGCHLSMGIWQAERILSDAIEGDPTHWMPIPDAPKTREYVASAGLREGR